LDTHCEELTTPLPNKLYSGNHKDTEEDSNLGIPREEIWSQKWEQQDGGGGSGQNWVENKKLS